MSYKRGTKGNLAMSIQQELALIQQNRRVSNERGSETGSRGHLSVQVARRHWPRESSPL